MKYPVTNLALTLAMASLAGCSSTPSSVTETRTEADCDALEKRAQGFLVITPNVESRTFDEARNKLCKNSIEYKKGATLYIQSIKCSLDVAGDQMSRESKKAAAMAIEEMEQSVRDTERVAKEAGIICPGLF